MAAVNRNHEGATAAILSNQFRNQRIQGHKGDGTARFLRCVIDARAFRTETGNIDATAAAIAVSPGQFACPVKNAFNIVLWRHHDITVGQGDFFPFVFQPPVGQDAPAEQEFLLLQQFCHFRIMPTDTIQPVIKIFPIITVLIFPDVEAKLIVRAKPFFFIHNASSIERRKDPIYCHLLVICIPYVVCKNLTL